MNEDGKYRYSQFPLKLLAGLFQDRSLTVDEMIIWGLDFYTTRINISPERSIQFLLQDCHNGIIVPLNLKESLMEIQENEREYLDDYNDSWLDCFKENTEELIYYGKLHKALKHFRLEATNIDDMIQTANKIKRKDKECYEMIKIETLFEFRDKPKTELEIALFCIYVAVKSIIGKSIAKKTNIDFILKRAFPDHETNIHSSDMIKKYGTRKRFETIRVYLADYWGIKSYSGPGIRGIYFSHKLDLVKLAIHVEKLKKKTKSQQFKEAQRDARLLAFNVVNNERAIPN